MQGSKLEELGLVAWAEENRLVEWVLGHASLVTRYGLGARPQFPLKTRYGSLRVLSFGSFFGGGKVIEILLIGLERFLLLVHPLVHLAQPQVGRRVLRIVVRGFLKPAECRLQLSLVQIDIPDLHALRRTGTDVSPIGIYGGGGRLLRDLRAGPERDEE